MIVLFNIDNTLIDRSNAVRVAVGALLTDLGMTVSLDGFVVHWLQPHQRH